MREQEFIPVLNQLINVCKKKADVVGDVYRDLRTTNSLETFFEYLAYDKELDFKLRNVDESFDIDKIGERGIIKYLKILLAEEKILGMENSVLKTNVEVTVDLDNIIKEVKSDIINIDDFKDSLK